jgi:hypothetical protein
MKPLRIFLTCLLSLLSPASRALAEDVQEICPAFSTADVTVTTTAETVVATSPACIAPGRAFTAVIKVSFTITTSADSATYKVRIRRDGVAGTALGDALSRTVQVAAGGVEHVEFMATDERAGTLRHVIYVATIEIASASATSTVGEAFIEVMIL